MRFTMKHIDKNLKLWEAISKVILRLSLLICLLVFSVYPISAGPHVSQTRQVDSKLFRATNAARQLLDHQQRLSQKTKNFKFPGILNQEAKVGFSFNKLMQTSSTVFFFDDAEHGDNGWTTQSFGDSVLWHQTTLDANTPTHSWWCGVDSQQNYNTGRRVQQALVSPLIDLSSASGPVAMMFTENYFTEAGWDFCMVDVSTNGGTNWIHLRGGYGDSPSGDSYGWKITTLNLSPYAGKQINIRFFFDTADSIFNNFTGWFIDNVAVYDQAGTIAGTVYLDLNQDGIQNKGEMETASLISVSGPMALTMMSYGSYSLPLPLGSYQISEVLDAPWVQTSSPATWSATLTTAGEWSGGFDFGIYRPGTIIRGIVFDDLNGDSVKENSDSLLSGWPVQARDSNNTWIAGVQSFDSGQYNIFVTDTGQYRIREYPLHNWVSTVPGGYPAEYLVDVPRLDTVLDGYLFGVYKLPVGSIDGCVFNDSNRNSIRDHLEPGLQGWFVTVDGWKDAVTDSSGNYRLDNIPVGPHNVYLYQRPGWKQSLPTNSYTINLDAGQTIDSLDFGIYAISPDTIRGTVFNDLDGDAVRDSTEPGLAGFEVHLGGDVIASAVTDDSGRYSFGGLWAGPYVVNIVISSHWRQTFPTMLHGHQVSLGDEQNVDSLNFGMMHDSTFNLSYRTFLPESIAYAKDNTGHLGKAVKPKAVASEATFDLVVPTGGMTGLHAEFSQKIDTSTLTVTHFPRPTHDTHFMKWDFTLPYPDTLVTGEHVIIFAHGNLGKPLLLKKYWWKPGGVLPPHWKPKIVSNTTGQGRLLIPMPDAVNLLDNIFSIGVPSPGIVVGVYGPHSVYNKRSNDVVKSLRDNHGIHKGPPRCLGVFSNNLRQITKPVETLPPSKGNNKLFAEALALKVNIQASNFNLIPFGLGDLIFQDSIPNSSNGLSIRKISAKLDTAMSQFDAVHDTCICDTNVFQEFYRTIRMIDSAFTGPMDTVSFVTGQFIAPTRNLATVPFLHLDSSFATIAATIQRPSKIPEVPKQFVLQQNYPNPFNPSTTIEFYLTRPSIVSMQLYNTLGQDVATLLERQALDDGWNQYTLSADAFRLASGVYFYRIVVETIPDNDNPTAQRVTMVKKMLYLK
jgi:hypothetical protein